MNYLYYYYYYTVRQAQAAYGPTDSAIICIIADSRRTFDEGPLAYICPLSATINSSDL